jgi:hypothetical protein
MATEDHDFEEIISILKVKNSVGTKKVLDLLADYLLKVCDFLEVYAALRF